MKSALILSATLLAACGFASAQTVTESKDPAKIAEIERHAQELSANPTKMGNDQMDGMHHKRKMHGHHMHHAKKMKSMPADAAASDTPMAAPAK